MKTILCILALLVVTASTEDDYVRRTVGGGYYGRGYYGHPVARGAAVAAGTAAVAATGWGWDQPYCGGGVYANRSYVTGRPTLFPRYYGGYGTGGYTGAYAAGGYYGGTYANRSYVTGRPTLIPRYYGGW